MAFTSLCASDPLLDFIRSTYGAIPLRVPDQRFQPLALFSAQARRARYLGTLGELARDPKWAPPRAVNGNMGEVSSIASNDIGWSAATDILGPFVSSALGIDLTPVKASLSGVSKEAEGVRIVIGSARRTMINPFAIAHAIGKETHQIPANLNLGRDSGQDLYIIDCVFVARELTLELVGTNSKQAAISLESRLAGKANANQLLRANSKLTITGSSRTPFAFTCLRIKSDEQGFIDQLVLGKAMPDVKAAPVASTPNVSHTSLGDSNELLSFDD